jgi:hypothetical protein
MKLFCLGFIAAVAFIFLVLLIYSVIYNPKDGITEQEYEDYMKDYERRLLRDYEKKQEKLRKAEEKKKREELRL